MVDDRRGNDPPAGARAPRERAYRMLPAPAGVILMRDINAEPAGVIRLAGEITAPGAVCDVLVMLSQTHWRGELVLSGGSATRTLFFDKGNIVGAQTSVENERLGAIMYRYGVLSEQDLARVAAHTRGGARFGAVALELGLITEPDVFRCLRHQVEEITYASFGLSSGTFCFLDGFDAAKLVAHQVISTQALLMDGVTRMDEIRYFREKIPSGDYVPVRALPFGKVPAEYRETYDVIDGRSSVELLGRVTGRGEFAITKDVYGLERLGHVFIQSPRTSGGAVALIELANSLLDIIHLDADGTGKGRELRKGLVAFVEGGAAEYSRLFAGAGPNARGILDPERVAANLTQLDTGVDPEGTLRRLLYEYVSFAVFCVGAAAGWQHEAELSSRLGAHLAQLEP